MTEALHSQAQLPIFSKMGGISEFCHILRINRIFTIVVITLCKSLHHIMRLLGRNGEALPGKLAQILCPDILRRMAEGIHCVCVTGTNGKTTTVQMLSKLMKKRFGEDLMENILGVNLPQSITFEFIHNTDCLGRMKCHYAVIECDEDFMPVVCRAVKPEIIVMTNLSEDQVSRFSSVDYVFRRIRSGLEACGGYAVFCANADDMYASRLATEYAGKTLLFGKAGGKGKDLCVSWDGTSFEMTEDGFSYSLIVEGEGTMKVESSIPGTFNVYNAMAALVATKALGMRAGDYAPYLKDVLPAANRMEAFTIDGIPMRMALVKNRASFDVMAEYAASLKYDISIVLAQAAELPDDMNNDWVEHLDLSALERASHIKKIFFTGKTADVWYKHFADYGFGADRIVLIKDNDLLMAAIGRVGLPVMWLPCYSESIRLRKVLGI